MGRNEDVIGDRQAERLMADRGNTTNTQRRYVNAWVVVLWYFLALVAVCFWLLRLLGIVDITV